MGPQTLLFILKVQDQASGALQGAGLAVASLAFALGAATAEAVKASIQFDRTFTQMQTLASVTADQVGMVSEAMKDMALATGQGPQQLAEAMYFASSSGFETAEAMQVVKASAEGAAIGLGSTEVVADALTSAMNTYGHSAMTAGEATGIMAVAVQNGKVEAEQLARALGNVVPIAANAGVSFRDVNSAIAAMSLSGLTAAEGATAVRQTLQAVVAPTVQARTVIKSLGMDYKELQAVFREKGYLEGVKELRRVLGTDVNMRMFLGDVQAVNGNLALIGDNAAIVSDIFKEVNAAGEQSLKGMFEIAKQSNAFKWDQGVALLKVALLDLGDFVMPYVISAVSVAVDAYGQLQSILSTTAAFWEDNSVAILAAVGAITAFLVIQALPGILISVSAALAVAAGRMTALAAAIAAANTASIAATFSSIASGVVLLGQAAVAAAASVWELTAALLANPMTWVVLGAAALAAGLYYLAEQANYTAVSIDEMAKQAGEGGTLLRKLYTEAQQATVDSNSLDQAARAAATGMGMGRSEADRFAQALRDMGVAAQFAAVQTAKLALTKSVVAMNEQKALVAEQTKEIKNGKAGVYFNKAPALEQLAAATKDVQIWTETTVRATAELNKAMAARGEKPPSPGVGANPNARDYERPTGGGGGSKAPTGKTEAEKEAERIQNVVEALKVQTQAYTQSAQQKEYLDGLRRAGFDILNMEQTLLEDGLKITEEQGKADQKLGGIRSIAQAVLAKHTAAITEHVREMDIADGVYQKVAETTLLSARNRVIETAAIEAQADAERRRLSATDTAMQVAAARKQAAAKFDADARRSSILATQEFDDQVETLQAQARAFSMSNREAEIFLAGERARIQALREGSADMELRIQQAQRLAAAQYDLDNRLTTAAEGVTRYMDELRENAISTGDIVFNSLSSAVNGLTNVVGNALIGQSLAWRKTASDVAASIAKMIAQMLIMKAVMAGLKMFGFSEGAAFDSNITVTPEPFAKGGPFTNGIFDTPTAFNFGGGKLGVMGEAGPEAVMPLIGQGSAFAVAAWAQDGTRKALSLMRGPDGSLGVQLPSNSEFFAKGGAFPKGALRPMSAADYGAMGAPTGGDTNISFGDINIDYTGSGDTKADAESMRTMRKLMEGMIDERIELATRRMNKNGGSNSMFGMKLSHA